MLIPWTNVYQSACRSFSGLRDIVHDSPAQEYSSPGASCLGDVQRYFAKAVVIPISSNSDNIRNYVEMRSDRDAEHDLRAGIVRVIVERYLICAYSRTISHFHSISDIY